MATDVDDGQDAARNPMLLRRQGLDTSGTASFTDRNEGTYTACRYIESVDSVWKPSRHRTMKAIVTRP